MSIRDKALEAVLGSGRDRAVLGLSPIALEPRYMFDAAGAATGAEAAQDAAAEAEADGAGQASGGSGSGDGELAGALDAHAPPGDRREIVFVDTSVSGYQALVDAVGESAEVIMLDGSQGGMAQIAAALTGQSGIDSIHIISHGDTGEVRLGTDTLTLDTMAAFQDELMVIRDSLDADGDILLYGCNVGEDGAGRAFIDALALATEADIAASDDLTGSSDHGGDWTLEATVGEVAATDLTLSFSTSQFSGVLVLTDGTENFNSDTAASNTASTTRTDTLANNWVVTTQATATQTVGIAIVDDDGANGSDQDINPFGSNTGDNFLRGFASGFGTQDNVDYLQLAADAGTFDLNSFRLRVESDSGAAGSSHNFTLRAMLNGVEQGTTTGSVSESSTNGNINWVSFNVAANTTFDGIDAFRIDFDSGVRGISVDDVSIVNAGLGNAAPALGGTPADDTATEDVATAIDLSAYNISDADGDNPITITLAVDRGTIASIDGNGTTDGVTVANSGTASMTLQGSIANLNTYLNDTSKITYTTALNDTTTAVLTVTPNDGTVNGTADTVNITITPVNDLPVMGGTPGDATITEDTTTAIDLSAYNVSDVEGSTITLTLGVTAGTIQTTDGNGTTDGVTISNSGTTSMTLEGSAANLNTYLNNTSKVTYTPVANSTAAVTLTVTPNDGTGDGAADTVTINITPQNDLPVMGGTPGDATITEDTATAIDLSAYNVSDVEGDTITLTLGVTARTIATTDGDGTTASVTIANSGTASMTLQGTAANLNTYLNDTSKVVYTPAANATAAVTLTVTPNDGTGNGAADTVTINITPQNDSPVLDAGQSPVLTGISEDAGDDDGSGADGDDDAPNNANNTGTSIAALVVDGSITDPDGGAVEAIAVTNVDNTNGVWQFSTNNGTSWTNFSGTTGSAVDIASTARLLDGTLTGVNTHLVRFVPDANYNGTATLTFRAWDKSTGSAASTANASSGGGSSPFSTATDTASVTISAVNDAPTLGGTPTDATINKDTTTAIDLSAYNVADVEGSTITLTLAVSAGTIQTTDGDGLTDGVTIANSGTASMTLQGTAANLNTYLNDTTKVTYTPVANSTSAVTLTVTPNDGTTNGSADTVTINITPVNDALVLDAGQSPALAGIAEDVTDGANTGTSIATLVVDGSITDPDGGAVEAIAVTNVDNTNGVWQYSTDNGTSWNNFSGTTGSAVDISGTARLLDGTLTGANTHLVRFVPGENYSGSATLTFRAWDKSSGSAGGTADASSGGGATAFSTATDTASVAVSSVNDAPVFTGLDGTPTFLEGASTGSILDANVTVADAELGSGNDFAGATHVLVRNGGANAVDSFSIATGGNLTVAGSNISSGGNVIASFNTASVAGQVTITFQNNGTAPTTALVNEVMQAIRYSNTSNDPASSVQINWTFSDGNSGNTQGSGDNPGTATGSTTVTVTNVSDAPTLTATGGNPTFNEGGGAQDLFNTVSASTVEAADRITAMTLTVTNVSDGASEILSFDGSDVALNNGNNVTTATNNLSVSVSVAGSTATVSFSGASLTGAQLQTLVDGLTYRNSSEAPTTAGNRVVTVTGITDNGSTANSGAISSAPNITSTVTVTGVNDQPTLSNFGPDAGNVAYTAGTATFVAFDSGTSALAADAELDALNSGTGNYNGATITLIRNGGANVTDRFGIAGGTTALTNGDPVTISSTNIGTVTSGSAAAGTITITLNSSATSALVDTFFQQIGYTNTNGAATGTVAIDVTLNDGNTGTQGSGGAQAVTQQVSVTIGNPPALGGAPADATINEDTTTAIDLSAYNVSDADGDTITITLAVSAGTIDTTDGNGVTDGVTIANSGTASMTLQGTAANLNTYLNDATKVRYAPVANSTAAVTLTVTPSDGSLTGTADTVTINITPVNDLPVMGGAPADATINEDTATAIDLSAYDVSDVEGDTITITLAVDAGTIATTDGNGTTGNVTIANSGTTSMTL